MILFDCKVIFVSSKHNTGGANIEALQDQLKELNLDDKQYERLKEFLNQKDKVNRLLF